MNESIDRKKYGGKYVVTRNFKSNDVVSSDKDPVRAYNMAIKKGVSNPVINFVHMEGVACIY